MSAPVGSFVSFSKFDRSCLREEARVVVTCSGGCSITFSLMRGGEFGGELIDNDGGSDTVSMEQSSRSMRFGSSTGDWSALGGDEPGISARRD